MQVSNWAADVEGLMHPPTGSCLSQLAMDVVLSLSALCTPSLSWIQSGLTWHTVGGVGVHTFEDHYILHRRTQKVGCCSCGLVFGRPVCDPCTFQKGTLALVETRGSRSQPELQPR